MRKTTEKIKNKNIIISLAQKRELLISTFLKEDTPFFMEKHAGLFDGYFRESFEASEVGPEMNLIKNPYAILALGGYGREEQCIYSDIDLLLLFEKNIPKDAEALIREVIYPLWDIGLDVSYATRSVKDCIHIAETEPEALTAMLDARFVCGVSLLYSNLMDQMYKKIILKRSRKVISWLVDTNSERHRRFGDSTYLLEPNLKEGHGGLRDYHTMLWIAKIKSNIKQPWDLERFGYLSQEEYQSLHRALVFVWRVRNHLHQLTQRKCDQLLFKNQEQLADILHFKYENGQHGVERFLGRLHGQMDYIKHQHQMFLYEQGYTESKKIIKRKKKQTKVAGLNVKRDRLFFTTFTKKILDSPELLIKIFKESVLLDIPLSSEANRVVGEFSYLVDDTFASSDLAVKSFEEILLARSTSFNVLDEMHRAGFLEKFIPEIKEIANRIQYDQYHLYPVDKHSFKTVETIKTFGTSDDITQNPLCRSLYKGLKDKRLLMWAALLHDIGKGQEEGNHAKIGALISEKILAKKGYKKADIQVVSFMIEHHLYLIKTATRRDIYEEQTAINCARKIADVECLKMLYLLTVADSISTGPKAWNDWTASLLRDFFLKVLKVLEKGELATSEAFAVIETKRKEIYASLSSTLPENKLDELYNIMSPRYRLYMPVKEILDHIDMYNTLADKRFVLKVIKSDDLKTRDITICAKDSPGLFSKISGVFTLNDLDILDGQVYTWRNNIALDIFKVNAPVDHIFEAEKWNKVEKDINDAFAGTLDLSMELNSKMTDCKSPIPIKAVRPHRVNIDNESSSFFTIIEVFTYDFPGLLYKITDTLFRYGLDIWVSKIATKADQVVDVFYVRDFDGQKVDASEDILLIKEAILDMLKPHTCQQ